MGYFSWKTQDTNQSISNRDSVRGALPVYMVNPKTGESYFEPDYDGYGRFGGKDYYELVAELNGKKTRQEGIDLEFNDENKEVIYPILVQDLDGWEQYKGQKPDACPDQGYFYEEMNEDYYDEEYY